VTAFSLSNCDIWAGKWVKSGPRLLAIIWDCFGIGRWARLSGASVRNSCSWGGGSATALSPFSARARGGGELDGCRPFCGDGAWAKNFCGGCRRVWWSLDTSVTGPKESRNSGSYVATSWWSGLAMGSWKICKGGCRRVAAIVNTVHEAGDAFVGAPWGIERVQSRQIGRNMGCWRMWWRARAEAVGENCCNDHEN
jgi:hypothetical protein